MTNGATSPVLAVDAVDNPQQVQYPSDAVITHRSILHISCFGGAINLMGLRDQDFYKHSHACISNEERRPTALPPPPQQHLP